MDILYTVCKLILYSYLVQKVSFKRCKSSLLNVVALCVCVWECLIFTVMDHRLTHFSGSTFKWHLSCELNHSQSNSQMQIRHEHFNKLGKNVHIFTAPYSLSFCFHSPLSLTLLNIDHGIHNFPNILVTAVLAKKNYLIVTINSISRFFKYLCVGLF